MPTYVLLNMVEPGMILKDTTVSYWAFWYRRNNECVFVDAKEKIRAYGRILKGTGLTKEKEFDIVEDV